MFEGALNLSHNSIFKELRAIAHPKFSGVAPKPLSRSGDKKPESRISCLNSASQLNQNRVRNFIGSTPTVNRFFADRSCALVSFQRTGRETTSSTQTRKKFFHSIVIFFYGSGPTRIRA